MEPTTYMGKSIATYVERETRIFWFLGHLADAIGVESDGLLKKVNAIEGLDWDTYDRERDQVWWMDEDGRAAETGKDILVYPSGLALLAHADPRWFQMRMYLCDRIESLVWTGRWERIRQDVSLAIQKANLNERTQRARVLQNGLRDQWTKGNLSANDYAVGMGALLHIVLDESVVAADFGVAQLADRWRVTEYAIRECAEELRRVVPIVRIAA